LALKVDKEAVLEFIIAKKDPLFILLLLATLIGGGWYLNNSTSASVDDIIREVRIGGGGPQEDEDSITSEDIVSTLSAKPRIRNYTPDNNPFGSPEVEQEIRKAIETAYASGTSLFNAGEYEKAIQQFERVVNLDVTESRLSYAILPSEFMRRAQRENAKNNFDKILASATTDIQEGDRLLNQNQPDEALVAYTRADNNLSEVIQSDQDGSAIGVENLNKVKDLQTQAFDKKVKLRRQTVFAELTQEMNNAQQHLQSQTFVPLFKSLVNLNRLQGEVQQLDPSAQLITRTTRDRLTGLITNIQNTLKENFPTLVAQSEQQFTQSLSAQDIVKTQEAILVLRQAIQFTPNDSKELQSKVRDFVARRAELVVQLAQKFITEQEAVLTNETFDQFDTNAKMNWLQEMYTLRSLGNELPAELRGQITSIENSLKSLRLPPPITEAYDFLKVEYNNNTVKIEYIDKSSRSSRSKTATLREGKRDTITKITLQKVDTTQGFVILSKRGYTDTPIKLSSAN
jgi:tetratricopeptide (TPR) repeat protein